MLPLASAYADEVDRVNQRLSEAVDLLRKGLRSEAIQRASLQPNVLDRAAELDFPEVGEWLEILQFLGVPVPALVDQNAAQQLNEAIVETQPLNELLRRHRKLAIAKAPLRWRLKVLRRIAQVDPMNHVWEEDLESWEQVRLKQIPAELTTAISEGDVGTVERIKDELTTESWRVEPGASLVDQATAAAQQFVYSRHVEQLRGIAPALHDAFSELNESLARQCRENWREVQAQMTAPPPVELEEQVAPALAWLEELDREAEMRRQRAAAIGLLESALDHKKPAADLQRAYANASRYDEPVPIELEQRFRVVVAEHELRAKRKAQAILVAIVATTLLVAVSLGYWQWNAKQDKKVTSASSQMKTLLDEGKLNEAEQFWNRIRASQPSVASSAPMTSLQARLTEGIEQEKNRATQFANYLEQADNPDPAKIDDSALGKAESLASTESEKGKVFAVRRQRSQWERELQAEHTKQAFEKLDMHRKKLEAIEAGSASIEQIQEISILISEVEKLEALFPKRAASVDTQANLVKSKAIAMRTAMQTRRLETQKQSDALSKVVDAVTLSAFSDALAAFAKALPDSAMAKEFTKAAQERTLWEQGLKSNDLIESLRLAVAGGITPDEAKSILTEHKKIAGIVIANPILEPFKNIDSTLEKIENREAILEKVFNELSLQTVAELMTIEVPKPGDPASKLRYFIYYSHFDRFRDRFRSSGNVGIEVVVDASGAVRNQSFVGPIEVIPEPRDTVRWLLRQKSDYSRKFLSDWNGAFLEAAAELRKRPQVDGTIKEMLLLQLLQGCSEGSDFASQSLAQAIKLLQRRDEQRQRWFVAKPLDSSLDPTVEQFVVPDMSRTFMNRAAEWRDVTVACQRVYQWVGCLLRDANGKITAQLHKRPGKAKGKLYVVRAAVADPNKVEFSEVGKWQNDRAVLSNSLVDLVAGRPLMFLAE